MWGGHLDEGVGTDDNLENENAEWVHALTREWDQMVIAYVGRNQNLKGLK